MPKEDDTALNEDDRSSDGAAAADDTGSDANAENASGGDTATDEGTAETEESQKEPDPIPYGRFKEVNEKKSMAEQRASELDAQNRQLLSDLGEMGRALAAGAKPTTTQTVLAKDGIEQLVESGQMTQDEANRFLLVLEKAGVQRGKQEDPRVQQLQSELAAVKNIVYGEKDSQERRETLERYKGIVTDEQLTTKLKEMVNSRDPSRAQMAKTASYDQIIKTEFFPEILQAETDKVLAQKKPGAPKLSASKGKEGVRKPAPEELEYDPANPRSFDAALKAEMRRKINAQGE